MKIDFSTELKLSDEQTARLIYESLVVEIKEERSRRSSESLALRGNCLTYKCQSPDIAAAQASINTFYSWFSLLESVFEII
ncbi:MAG: KEOPS complex subunit Pcc1 [Candidatus Odinarchaeota archaeon]